MSKSEDLEVWSLMILTVESFTMGKSMWEKIYGVQIVNIIDTLEH